MTQLGTQIHALDNYRRVVELVQSGAIGAVREVHVFCDKSWGGGDRPKESEPVPKHLHWDLWLGPAPERPYHARAYHPASWRRFWDFGGGTLGDMACHYLDLVHWALDLGSPTTVAAEGPPLHDETTPPWLIVRYAYPARGAQPAVDVAWWDGGKRPEGPLAARNLGDWKNGVLFVGEEGWIVADYFRRVLGPDAKFRDHKPKEPWIATSVGHHREWVEACLARKRTTCDFGYSGALTEAVLLGNVAYRAGAKIGWDAATLTVTGADAARTRAAQALIDKEYRRGWTP